MGIARKLRLDGDTEICTKHCDDANFYNISKHLNYTVTVLE